MILRIGLSVGLLAVACFALTANALAEPIEKSHEHLFGPIPAEWTIAKPNKKASPSRPTPQFVWSSSEPARSKLRDFGTSPVDPPMQAIDRIALGDSILRYDGSRDTNDIVSETTGLDQSPDSANFRPLAQHKHKRSRFGMPYMGFTLSTPTH